ncbi:MAG: sn-glycerol-3-phosphate ABC transporter ATP-binding protein UgpC [Pseudomonadota bacterium]
MATIALDNVTKRYGETLVIDKLSLDISDQEFVVFVGPSGCGKSTALRMIAGLESVSDGQLSIGGRVVNDVHPKDRDCAMVFQSYALYPHMTVFENIAFGLKIRKTPISEIERRVNDAARILELGQFLDRKPRELSGGQRQRVALGRAIVRNPSVFLFDEPLSNLDAELRGAMRAEIAQLQQNLRTTMVYVTHDQVEAMTLGDRIAVLAPLSRGYGVNLMQVGAPMDLYMKPKNAFVAKFIGTPPMSMFKGVMAEDRATIQIAGRSFKCPDIYDLGPHAAPGSEILVGLRPEHVRAEPRSHWINTLDVTGKVKTVEFLGHEAIIHLDIGAEEPLLGKLTGRGRTPPRVGDEFTMVAHLERLHLFDPKTENRLPERKA